MAKEELFSGESKNVEYKVTVPDKKRKIYENGSCFCQWQRWQNCFRNR